MSTTKPVTTTPTPTPTIPIINARDVLVSSYIQLLEKVKDQNAAIVSQIEEYDHIHSTNYTESVYESESAANLQVVYNFLFYIYYFIAFIFILYIFFKYGVFQIHTLLILLVVLFFPFIIIPVENFLKNVVLYIYSLLTQNVYEQK